MQDLDYDEDGKIILDDIYNKPNPVAYYTRLSKLDYCIPQEAKPYFSKLIAARREAEGREHVKFVDVGCSYGVNAAMLKYDLTMPDLVAHYEGARGMAPDVLLARDREFYGAPADRHLDMVGIDAAPNAVNYSAQAGILDEGINANLEEAPLDGQNAAAVADADLVTSTGCFGYVSETTLERIYETSADRQPWMAHFVLRMFDFEPAAEMLSGHGYVTEALGRPVRQRRFASTEEREHALDNLEQAGVSPAGWEDEGWFYAQLYVSRPEAVAGAMPIERLDGAPA